MKASPCGFWTTALLLGGLLGSCSARAELKPFPLTAGQRGIVTCLEDTNISYDIYLPPSYSTNGTPLPILYTLNPSGGGLVTSFSNVCSLLNVITVGFLGYKNGQTVNNGLRECYAVPRDIRQRVLFDPTAVFVGGFSGGGEGSYIFSRFWSQHAAGIVAMGGWLGRYNISPTNVAYFSTDRVQTNLLVARTTGDTDTATVFYNPYDSNFLASCGAVVRDWTFSGGHAIPPDIYKQACLGWLLSRRTPAGPNDRSNSQAQATSWYSRAATGQSEAVFRECVATLMNQPRTWFALQAQLVMDDLMTNYASFRSLNLSNLYPAGGAFITNAWVMTDGHFFDPVNYVYVDLVGGVDDWSQSDLASDLFFYYARGAAINQDWQRYHCALKALNSIAGTSGDRAGDIYYVLTNFNYTAPRLQFSGSQPANQMNLLLQEDAPGLAYSVQTRTNLTAGLWQDINPVTTETNTLWSAEVGLDPGLERGFYRVGTTPVPGISPPWPANGGAGQ